MSAFPITLRCDMALVKNSKIAALAAKTPPRAAAAKPVTHRSPARKGSSGTRQETLVERVAAATEELASGLAEASAAAQQLRSSLQQIASGAEEAAGASQEQLAAIKRDHRQPGNRSRPRRTPHSAKQKRSRPVLAETARTDQQFRARHRTQRRSRTAR